MPPTQPGARSRRGCVQCRRGHHKCDEGLPSCARCRGRGYSCEYNRVRWGSMFTAESIRFRRRGHPRPEEQTRELPNTAGQYDDHTQGENAATPPSSHTESPPNTGEAHDDGIVSPLSPDTAAIDPALSPHSVPALLFQHPDEAAAYSYYVERLAGDIQALDSLDNPYRKLSIISLSYPVLLYTTISCAAEHMHLLGRYPIDRAISQHNRAIRAIRVQLETWHASRPSSHAGSRPGAVSDYGHFTSDQALLMAILLQPAVVAFSHCDGPSAESYLDIGFYMIQELGYLGRQDSPDSPGQQLAAEQLSGQPQCHWAMESYFPRLFVQRFAIVDLGISIFRRRRPHLSPTDWFASPSLSDRLDHTRPSFRDMAGSSHTAFVFVLRATHLAMDLEEADRPQKQIYSDAIALETDIRIYDTQLSQQHHSSNEAHKTSITAVARLFAHTALLLLLRRCFREPCTSPRVQHAVASVFSMVDMVPVTSNEGTSDPQQIRSGLDSSTCMPFYVAAREAQSKEDQDWVRQKNRQWRKVYPMPARALLLDVAERIWKEREKGGENMEERCRRIEESCKTYIF